MLDLAAIPGREFGRYMTERILQFVREQLARLELADPVVEFGSFQVPTQEEFADIRKLMPGREFIGCDMQPGPGVDVIDDMEHSRLPACSAGTIFCLETLEHVKHPWAAFAEAHRILKPGGTLIVSVPFRMQIHGFPEDYWRMTPSALEILMNDAGFTEVETWDDGSDIIDGLPYPMTTFGVCRKRLQSAGGIPDYYRASAILRDRDMSELHGERETVPVVIPLWGRVSETRKCLEQFKRVTDDYSLVLVDNGFEDPALIEEMAPEVCLTNQENAGVVKAINQGLDACGRAPYLAVMHSDVLILDEGWLDHIIEFMERRQDVGLVALAGRHTVREDGSLDLESTVLNQEQFQVSCRPTWRFTEVAVADGMCFVMRNIGLRLDESLGFMHFYDLDISLQYIEAGYRVYVAGIDCQHLAGFVSDSSRSLPDYLEVVGGDDDAFYQEVRERFRSKWQHMLPVSRGYRDEAYGYYRVDELTERNEELEGLFHGIETLYRRAEAELELTVAENEKAAKHIAKVERELSNCHERIVELERGLAPRSVEPAVLGEPVEQVIPHRTAIWKVRHYMASEGLVSTARRSISYTRRKLGR
jgi:glycosyltransferase involved in cell wall biosynthesis